MQIVECLAYLKIVKQKAEISIREASAFLVFPRNSAMLEEKEHNALFEVVTGHLGYFPYGISNEIVYGFMGSDGIVYAIGFEGRFR